jgi:hypothetical protein
LDILILNISGDSSLLCAGPVINPALSREQVNLAEWAMQCHRKGVLDKIIDPRIVGTTNEQSLKKHVEAAEKCLAEQGVDRPCMGDVLWNLESMPSNSCRLPLKLKQIFQKAPITLLLLKSQIEKILEETTVYVSDDSQLTVSSPLFLLIVLH